MSIKPHILDYDLDQWNEYFLEKGHKKYRALQLFIWLHQKNEFDVEKYSNIPKKIKTSLREEFRLPAEKPKSYVESKLDGTVKFLWQVSRGDVESVWLPFDNRQSICISVQSGCTLNCSFCATGKLKFRGNLSTGEILEQVYSAQKYMNIRISNVVYMGMGEPFHNFDNVIKSAQILTHDHGANLSARRITISTSGILPKIQQYIEEGQPYSLALSVHAIQPEKRAELMDIENKYSLEYIASYISSNREKLKKRQFTIEYIMIRNKNMYEEDIQLLSKFAKRTLGKVNLIPLNTNYNNLERPNADEIEKFWMSLVKNEVLAFNRSSPGLDIDGACGMLARNKEAQSLLTEEY